MVKRNEYSYYQTATLDSLKFSSSSVRDTPSHLTMKKISVTVRDTPSHLTMKKISVTVRDTPSHLTMKKISVTVRDTPSHLTMKKISVTVRDTPSHLTMKKISFSRHSTQSTASICCTPIRSPAIVIQTSGASRDVVYVVFLDSLHTHFSLHDPDYSGLYVQSNIVLRLSSRISLGCSADYSTVASMVIAHKVGRYAGKASLYAWNSSILEDFSSVSVDLRFSYVIALDLMTAFEMDLYSSFPGFVEFVAPPGEFFVDDKFFGENPWLNLTLKLILIYGSLPRPPDVQSHVVCTCFLIFSKNAASRPKYVVDGVEFWRYLASRYASREGELRLDIFCISLCDVAEVFALSATHEVLLKQSLPQIFMHIQSRDCGFFGCIFVVISGRFGTVTTILYGSLPRPPEDLYALLPFRGVLHVQDASLLYDFHLEGEY